MQIQQHWLTETQHIPSPNYSLRPDPNDISLIVLHCISLPVGKFCGEYISQLFCNQLSAQADPSFITIHKLQVSAHILIRRTGEIIQYVGFNHRAWHAGVSEYQGRTACNDFSIGIELEGEETIAYTDVQYQQLTQLVKLLCATYSQLNLHTITGHSDIAPKRKTDPGASFCWRRLQDALNT